MRRSLPVGETTGGSPLRPVDMQQIDAALAAHPKLSAEQLAEVKKLRAEGEAQHNAGDHAASVETLAKAKKILGI